MPCRVALYKSIRPYDKGLIRMSWHKKNLENIMKKSDQNALDGKTVFQQKWLAKKELRAYHGPQVTEKQFIDRHLTLSFPVSNMGPDKRTEFPPFQTLLFSQLERRVDTIVFRSHFTNSIYSARKMVISGKVLVNGQVCRVPSHMVSPGDMITVDPEWIPTLKGDKNTVKEFKPIPYMSAFMFTPRYLEVDYNTCSTIYLRHPAIRSHTMEIPSPFPPRWHQLVFEWYARIARGRARVPRPIPPTTRTVVNGQYIRLKKKFLLMHRRDKYRQQQEKLEKKPAEISAIIDRVEKSRHKKTNAKN